MALTKTRKIGKILNGNLKISVVLDSDRIDSSSTKGVYITPTTLVVATTDDLPATSFNGKKALVTSTNSSYMYSNGWYKLNTSNKFSPYWITEPDSEYTLDLTSIDSDVKIVVLAFDSDDVPITYTAVVDSDFNVSATISHDSDKDNVWIVRRRDSDSGAGTTGSVTFKASDGVNLTQKVVAFITSANTTYEFLGTVESVYSGTVLNLDSDMESLISAGDVLTNAAGGGSEATISSVSFLNDTYAARTDLGTIVATGAGDQGTGFFGVNTDGSFSSTHYNRVASVGISSTVAKTRFRTGDVSGGQIISSHTNQSFSSSSVSASANSPHYVFGFPLKSLQYQGRAQLLVAQSYGAINPALATGTYSFNSNGSSPATVSSILTTYQGNTIKSHNPFATAGTNFDFLSLIITYWNGRYNYMEYTNTTGVTYFRCQYDRTSWFTAGKVFYPVYYMTAQKILEGKSLTVMSSSYNSGTGETTVYCGNQYGLQIREWEDTGGTARTMTTGSVTTPANGGHYYAAYISKSAQAMQLINNSITNTSLDVQYNSLIQGQSLTTARDLTFYEVASTTTNYYKVATTPSPAGDGTNIALGTSNAGSNIYSWKNVTSAVVDDTTGFTAGDNIYKKIG